MFIFCQDLSAISIIEHVEVDCYMTILTSNHWLRVWLKSSIPLTVACYWLIVNVSVMDVHILSRNYHRSDLSHSNYSTCGLWLF